MMTDDETRIVIQEARDHAIHGRLAEAQTLLQALANEHEARPAGLPLDVLMRWWEVFGALQNAKTPAE